VRSLCRPKALSPRDIDLIEELVAVRRQVKQGKALIRRGQEFTSLYAIRTGFFKTRVATASGREQVMGFQMEGDVIGLDGIEKEQYMMRPEERMVAFLLNGLAPDC
jgi:CRP/FNR family transcriptional regulator